MTKLSFLLVGLLPSIALSAESSEEQCLGLDPMPSVSSYLGATLDYEVADRICCHNHRYAEPRGYLNWPEVDFFGRLDPTTETVFYDSVCGIPLFVAPRNRTFDEFREESIHHGWPSFRPEEIISENVIIHPDGRMESKCLTHLGHNLPSHGVDRYCIDLVCIAGTPLNTTTAAEGMSDTMSDSMSDSMSDGMSDGMSDASETSDNSAATSVADVLPDDVLTAEDFNESTYTSSAEQWSGNNNITRNRIIISVLVVGGVVCAALVLIFGKRAMNKRKADGEQTKGSDSPVSSDPANVTAMDGGEKSSDNMSGGTSDDAEGV